MMYANKLAVAIKSAGKVLREFKDEVYVPFGSEYSIYVKNINSVRALVSVSVDGEDIGGGTQFVVNANDSIELERFIKNGNFSQGNRFKFIERTGAVEQHRGVGVADGLVRVSFQFEKPQPTYTFTSTYDPWYGSPYRKLSDSGYNWGDAHITTTCSGSLQGSSSQAFYNANVGSVADSARGIAPAAVNFVSHVQPEVANDVGVTVPGSISDQRFHTVAWFPVESETHVIVLKMLGQTRDNVQVRKAVTVKAKPSCTTCGRTNKANAKFCIECGTSLQIV